MKAFNLFTVLQCLFLISICSAQQNFRLRILHNNDMHARFEEISRTFVECQKNVWTGLVRGNCYGGFARIATIVRKYRHEFAMGDKVPTIYLNAGDTFHGHGLTVPAYDNYKWRVVAALMNKLRPDVACLGNHEFDLGLNNLASYLQNINFPMVGANIDWSHESMFNGIPWHKSLILVVNGRRIGVIGHLTRTTKLIARRSTGSVKFKKVFESVQTEVNKLKSKGVNIIIALGHNGYEKDQRMAREVEGLDVVIGGHSHTFLQGNGTSSNYGLDCDISQGPYPTVVTQPNTGRKVLVIQTMAYTKYIGKLIVDFDNRGEIVNFFGNPILLDSSVEQAQDVLDEVANWK